VTSCTWLLDYDEPHGLAIKDELENYYEKEIHHGRLYPNLDTLVEKGLIEKGKGRPSDERLFRDSSRTSGDRRSTPVGRPVRRRYSVILVESVLQGC